MHHSYKIKFKELSCYFIIILLYLEKINWYDSSRVLMKLFSLMVLIT